MISSSKEVSGRITGSVSTGHHSSLGMLTKQQPPSEESQVMSSEHMSVARGREGIVVRTRTGDTPASQPHRIPVLILRILDGHTLHRRRLRTRARHWHLLHIPVNLTALRLRAARNVTHVLVRGSGLLDRLGRCRRGVHVG